jgi:hypothetical protein
MSNHEISFNTNLSDPIRKRADFSDNITPAMISISNTGLGKCRVSEDINVVLQKIEHWHQGSIAKFKHVGKFTEKNVREMPMRRNGVAG